MSSQTSGGLSLLLPYICTHFVSLRVEIEESGPICSHFNVYKSNLYLFPAKGATTSAKGGRLPDDSVTSTPSLVMATKGGNMTTEPVADTSAGSSAPAPSGTSSLDVVLLLSSVTEPGSQRDVSQHDADLDELPTKPLPVFPPGVSVSSFSPSSSGGFCGFARKGLPPKFLPLLSGCKLDFLLKSQLFLSGCRQSSSFSRPHI